MILLSEEIVYLNQYPPLNDDSFIAQFSIQ